MDLFDLNETSPYSLKKEEKSIFLNKSLNVLFRHHYNNCELFKKSMDSISYDYNKEYDYYELPFLPVQLFKLYELKSIDDSKIVKTLTSSGTSGQTVSKIFLDKEASVIQIKTLSKIVTSFSGSKRLPMIIIDSKSVLKDRKNYSARGAGILGFSMFGTDHTYALDDEMNLNINDLKNFLDKHKGQKILMFGFTFIIYQHFYKELLKSNITLDLSNATLIHGGGWKKMIDESVSSSVFKNNLNQICSIKSVHDYYGMVEQTGTIYMECEKGYLHTSIFSDIIIRREQDFSVAEVGEPGIIQVVSVLPKSYPGQSLLTEDEGVLLGEDDCKCGRMGKYFKINGRLKDAEIRGCSDTYGKGN
tara:strand:- start:1154 stop:2233 length:1080 start_codon:yes stop_codon:yes gene_type:complete